MSCAGLCTAVPGRSRIALQSSVLRVLRAVSGCATTVEGHQEESAVCRDVPRVLVWSWGRVGWQVHCEGCVQCETRVQCKVAVPGQRCSAGRLCQHTGAVQGGCAGTGVQCGARAAVQHRLPGAAGRAVQGTGVGVPDAGKGWAGPSRAVQWRRRRRRRRH